MRVVSAVLTVMVVGTATGAARAQGGYGANPAPAAANPTSASAPLALPKLGGYTQVRGTYVEPTKLSFTLNRARLSVDGPLPNRFSYRMLVEYESGATARAQGTVSLREAIIRWSLAPYAIQGGQFKSPFSREYLVPVPQLETADFASVVDSLSPKYELGAMGEVVLPYLALYSGVFNGEGQNLGLNRDSTVLWVSRATVRPIPQATLGGNVAYYSRDSTRYGADLTLEQYGGFVRGEFIGQRKTGRDRDDLGWYVLAGYRVLPWLQLIAQQEDYQRPGIGRQRRVSAYLGGFNLELPGGRTRFLVNLVKRTTGFPRTSRNTLVTQAQVRF